MTLTVGDEVTVKEIGLDGERVQDFTMKVDYIKNGWFELKGSYKGVSHYIKFPIDTPADMLCKIGITINKGTYYE